MRGLASLLMLLWCAVADGQELYLPGFYLNESGELILQSLAGDEWDMLYHNSNPDELPVVSKDFICDTLGPSAYTFSKINGLDLCGFQPQFTPRSDSWIMFYPSAYILGSELNIPRCQWDTTTFYDTFYACNGSSAYSFYVTRSHVDENGMLDSVLIYNRYLTDQELYLKEVRLFYRSRELVDSIQYWQDSDTPYLTSVDHFNYQAEGLQRWYSLPSNLNARMNGDEVSQRVIAAKAWDDSETWSELNRWFQEDSTSGFATRWVEFKYNQKGLLTEAYSYSAWLGYIGSLHIQYDKDNRVSKFRRSLGNSDYTTFEWHYNELGKVGYTEVNRKCEWQTTAESSRIVFKYNKDGFLVASVVINDEE